MVNIATDCDWNQVLRPDASVRWIKGDPSSSGDKYFNPSMGRPRICRPKEAVLRIGQIAGHDPGTESKNARSFGEQDREIAARAPSPVECLNRRLGSFCVAALVGYLREYASADVFQKRQGVGRAGHDKAFDPSGKAAIEVAVLRNSQRTQIRPFVGGVHKRVIDGRVSYGKDRPGWRVQFHAGAAFDHQMICLAVKDGGGDGVAGHIMRPSYVRHRRNGQRVREQSQFPCFPGTQHQPVRPERDPVTVSVGCGVSDVETGQKWCSSTVRGRRHARRWRSAAAICARACGNGVSPDVQPLAAPANPLSETFAPEQGIASQALAFFRNVAEGLCGRDA